MNPYVSVMQINLFDLILYTPVNFSAMSGWVFLCLTRIKQRIKFLAQGHNTVLFVWFDSLCHSDQFFIYVRMGLPGLNQP